MLSGLEIVVIGGIVIVLLMWGPKKIPEIARSLGEARRSFDESKKAIALGDLPRIEEEKKA